MGKTNKTRSSKSFDTNEECHLDLNSSSIENKSLYSVLGVEQTSTQQEIKKAYYKLALRLHPDKNPGDEEAKEKFQRLQTVVSILGDEDKRAIYDQTGSVDDTDLTGDIVENMREYFRSMYKKVTQEDIEEFEANYRGSDSEETDLLNLFRKFKGNMNRVLCSMLCSDPKLDSHRFKDIVDQAVVLGEVKTNKMYQKWSKLVSATKPPTSPLKRKNNRGGRKKEESDLYALMSQRRTDRKDRFDSLFTSLVTKYGGGEGSPEPSEAEFEKARRNLESRSRRTKQKCGGGEGSSEPSEAEFETARRNLERGSRRTKHK